MADEFIRCECYRKDFKHETTPSNRKGRSTRDTTYQSGKVGIDPDVVLPDQSQHPAQHVADINARPVATATLSKQFHHVPGEFRTLVSFHVVLDGELERIVCNERETRERRGRE